MVATKQAQLDLSISFACFSFPVYGYNFIRNTFKTQSTKEKKCYDVVLSAVNHLSRCLFLLIVLMNKGLRKASAKIWVKIIHLGPKTQNMWREVVFKNNCSLCIKHCVLCPISAPHLLSERFLRVSDSNPLSQSYY